VNVAKFGGAAFLVGYGTVGGAPRIPAIGADPADAAPRDWAPSYSRARR